MEGNDRLIRAHQAQEMLSISEATFYRRVRDGTIPAVIRICGAARWKLSEIQQVIDTASAARG